MTDGTPDPAAFREDERRRLAEVAARYNPHKDFDGVLMGYIARQIVENRGGERALELGCSTGVVTGLLVEHWRRVVVVDGSADYIERVRAGLGNPGHVDFHAALFEEFETEERFDDVILSFVLEHVVDSAALLRQARGLLAPGGRVHAAVPNAHSLHRRVGVGMGIIDDLDTMSERDHLVGHRRLYTMAGLEAELVEAGLRPIARHGNIIKPLSNAQMADWDPGAIRALYEAGLEYPELGSQLYFVCEAR